MLLRKLYYLKRVMKQQWLRESELKELQIKMLRAVITHAYRYVPFYKRKWKEFRIGPDDIKTLDDLKKLPIITREDLIKNYNQFIALNYKYWYETERVITRSTTGTTGDQFKMIFDKRAWDYLDAVYLRALLEVGYNPKKPLAYYWYEPFEREMYNLFGFMNKIYIPCNIPEEEQLKILQRVNPEYIYYYSSIIYSIAKEMLHEGIRLNPKVVVTHAEILSNRMRKIIQKAFDAPVLDEYGTTEFNRLAWECEEKHGYHVDADSLMLEAIKDGELVAPGEKGSVVLTGLKNFILPLIRYEIGDIVIPTDEKCSCGRVLPLIKSIEGRTEDLVVLKSGKSFTPKIIIDSIADIPEIYKFRISYLGKNRFNIDLVLLNEFKGIIEIIEKNLQNLFGERIELKSNIKYDILKSKRGKRKMTYLTPKVKDF